MKKKYSIVAIITSLSGLLFIIDLILKWLDIKSLDFLTRPLFSINLLFIIIFILIGMLVYILFKSINPKLSTIFKSISFRFKNNQKPDIPKTLKHLKTVLRTLKTINTFINKEREKSSLKLTQLWGQGFYEQADYTTQEVENHIYNKAKHDFLLSQEDYYFHCHKSLHYFIKTILMNNQTTIQDIKDFEELYKIFDVEIFLKSYHSIYVLILKIFAEIDKKSK